MENPESSHGGGDIPDAPDHVWMAFTPCPACDIGEDFQGTWDDDDDDDDDGGDAADAGEAAEAADAGEAADATEVIADVAEVLLDALAAVLMENDELVDGQRVLDRLQSVARRLKNNPSIRELIEARRRAVSKQ